MRLFRSRIGYVLLIFALMLYAAIVKSRNAELLMYGVLLLPVFTLVYALITLPFVKITAEATSSDPVKGDALTVLLRVKNASILPIPYLTVYSNVHRDISYDPAEEFLTTRISLGPMEERTLELDILCRRHGYFTAGATGFAVVDYLRLFRLRRSMKPFHLLVFPAVRTGGAALLTMLPSRVGGDVGGFPGGGSSPETGDVRAYQPGDRLSMLHHSLSSRGFGKFTRVGEPEGDKKLTVLYDANGTAENTDLLAHLASALIYDAMGADWQLRLITGTAPETVYGLTVQDYAPADMKKALAALAESCRQNAVLRYAMMDAGDDCFRTCGRLIFFAAELDEETLLFASKTHDLGALPVIIVAGEKAYSEDIFRALGVEVWFAGNEDDDPVWSLV